VTIAIRPSFRARDGCEREVFRVWAASGQGCGKLARRANQVRRPKSCQVQSNCCIVRHSGREPCDKIDATSILRQASEL